MTGSEIHTDYQDEYQQLLNQCKPGAALKLIREGKSVELADIATDTLIPEWKLADLENDNYGGLGGETFVVGYLRKVAKILLVDSDPLIVAFSQSSLQPATESHVHLAQSNVKGFAANTTASPSVMGELGRSLLNKINALPGSVAIAALLFVWVAAVVLMRSPTTENVRAPELAVANPPAPAVSASHAPLSESASVVGEHVDTVEREAPAIDSPSANVALAATPHATVSESDEATIFIDNAVVSPDASDLLALSFSDDCWVKISDATGEVLFAELKLKGDNLQLFGEAPFEVMLGNARAADVLLNGQPFTLNPSPNRKTLRVTVQL